MNPIYKIHNSDPLLALKKNTKDQPGKSHAAVELQEVIREIMWEVGWGVG